MPEVSKLKPGLLVSLKTTVQGGVEYRRNEKEHTQQGNLDILEWETTRIIQDTEEFERAQQARSAASGAIRRQCYKTSFGLLCPVANREQLEASITEARRIAEEHNAQAQRTRVNVYVIMGEIAQDDDEAARAITAELNGLMQQMQEGMKNLDPAAIRDAADKARQVGMMLDASQEERVGEAIKAARKAARDIVRRIEKDGEQAAEVMPAILAEVNKIETARFAFLDLDAPAATADQAGQNDQAEQMPAVNVQRFGDLFAATEPAPVPAIVSETNAGPRVEFN